MLDREVAWSYAAAWAKEVRADLKNLKLGKGRDFFGQLGSLGFDYLADEGMLVVRAYLFPYSASFTSKEDLLPWLNQIAAEDPDSVSHGTFETCTPRWEPDKEPSLFLRMEIREGSRPTPELISRLIQFRADSVVWSNYRLTKALDGLVRKRREGR